MKTVICFGDTNTWGVDPRTDDRLDFNIRWTGILSKLLKENYRVIEEGQAGRTIMSDDPVEPYKNGYDYLMPCLDSHRPVDLLIIMLGTVLLKGRFHQTADDIAISIEKLVQSAINSKCGPNGTAPKVLLISPIAVGNVENTWLSSVFPMDNNRERQRKFKELYSKIAERNKIEFMAAEDYAKTSEDGIHIALESHAPFAEAVANRVKIIFEGKKFLNENI